MKKVNTCRKFFYGFIEVTDKKKHPVGSEPSMMTLIAFRQAMKQWPAIRQMGDRESKMKVFFEFYVMGL